MIKKINNKGNTLAIVIIGIFILSVLGTLILGITSTNYRMKLNDKKNETTFYYAEKAIDELYAGIGADVMKCVTDSYTQVLEEYVSIAAADASRANDKYKILLRDKITGIYADGDIKTVAGSKTNVQEMFEWINSKTYISAVDRYEFSLFSPTSEGTEIKYYEKSIDLTDPSKIILKEVLTANGNTFHDVDVIKINNVGLRCESKNSGYSSSVITNFQIEVPDIDMDFTDSKLSAGLEDLANYSLICQGANLQRDYFNTVNGRIQPAISVNDSAKVTIKGNVYADGTVYNAVDKYTTSGQPYKENSSTVVSNNPSIKIGNNAELNINSKVLVCNNDFVLNTNSSATLRNMVGADVFDTTDSLQFFVNNIKTEMGTDGAKLDIAGNTIVKDDLEINGKNSKIVLKGNYFGYGFRDNDNNGVEDASNAITGFVASSATTSEHTQSSAMIINGNGATLDMDGLSKLVLGGRAYVDLDASGTNTSYMTGESISFKGNQNIYLADEELIGSKVAGMNPVKLSTLATLGYTDGSELTYDILGVPAENRDKIVAKKIDEDVYFYTKNPNPDNQTSYFMNAMKNSQKRQNLLKQIQKLDVEKVSFSSSLLSYTAGSIMKASVTENGNVDYSLPVYGEKGITTADFLSIRNVINDRVKSLVPSLKDISSTHILGQDAYMENGTESKISPYEYYIDRDKLLDNYYGIREEQVVDLQNPTAIQSSLGTLTQEQQTALVNETRKILIDEGVLDSSLGNIGSVKVGYVISAEAGSTSATPVTFDAGVIVAESPYTINKNFTGLIICNGEMYVSGNVNINASVKLSMLFLSTIPALQDILKLDVKLSGVSETGDIVDIDSVKYTDLVSKSNWRKSNE